MLEIILPSIVTVMVVGYEWSTNETRSVALNMCNGVISNFFLCVGNCICNYNRGKTSVLLVACLSGLCNGFQWVGCPLFRLYQFRHDVFGPRVYGELFTAPMCFSVLFVTIKTPVEIMNYQTLPI